MANSAAMTSAALRNPRAFLWLFALCATLLAPTGPSAAASTPQPAAEARTAVVFNRPVVTFRASFLGATPADRADAAAARILTLLGRGGPGTVETESIPQGIVVKIDGALAFVMTPDDADALTGESVAHAADGAADALRRVLDETREGRDLRRLGVAALRAALATAMAGALVWGLLALRRRVAARILQTAARQADRLKLGGAEVVQRERVLSWVRWSLAILFWIVVLLIGYEWLGFVLSSFPYTRPWGEGLTRFLVTTGVSIATGIAHALPDLVTAIVIFLIARFVARALGGFFDRVERGTIRVDWLDADLARPTRRIAGIVVWIFALVMAYPYLPGADTDAFKGISVLIGLMISLGGASVVGQAASGLILMYTRTIRAGEYVRIADHEGTIVELTLYLTRIRTGLGEELTLPNALVLGSVVRNYSRAVKGRGFVLDTTVTIGYDTPWRQVEAMLAEAARRTPGVLAEPAPRVFQTALADFYPEYRLVCQAIPSEPRPRAEVLSALHRNVQDVFNEHGVQIMSPHYMTDPAEAKVVPPAKWRPPPAPAVDGPATPPG
jgi:small-conductance mechanosensitive channel